MVGQGSGRTLVEKVIAKAAGLPDVRAGDLVTAKVDLAFAHDSSGPRRWRPLLEELDVGLWDPAKVAIVSDHYVPAVDAESAAILKTTRDFARDYGVSNFFDMVGICHLVLPEHGLIRPGAFIAGGDSHTPTAGGFGAYAAGYGATDMAAIAATGETWLAVPETIRVEWTGGFAPGVTAKDVMLFLCRELGMDNAFKAVEFAGPLVEAMPMAERMVLANMAAELGAETGVVAPDAVTFAHLAARGAPVTDEAAALALHSDADAAYAAVHRFDAADLIPQIAAPHSPANTRDATEFSEVRIDQAYIGACVGAKIEDLRMAADVLRGRRVAPGVRLLVAPGSARTAELAAREGVMETLLAAGAVLMPSGCGACAGMGAGILAEGETCISSTNRNFQGRMGHAGANVYLGSPYAVAAAAATGRIVDPRPFLTGAA
ncbi:aconitase/3-isopropylmalate dehydratase large subunit family protein [Caulobacter endophyticus]|uniref:aconitase/3-isopropylmalate dehydratase large subunit family protein n=1 Tax=Caulobacter endophyticus TaxID=2172652 RepID=UPI00240EB4D8|nr:aconitase/3-isopropylmalate dehydratase large subunit family protein [Caulobacter endophyticus]MDG2527357.1 aconitase/3-isopropylmalate dehydratase large subunit family protein [Caulobacter endophyticus]